jgi:hypothetical protein
MAQLRQYRSGGCLQWALQRRRQLSRLRRGRDNRIKRSPAFDNGLLFLSFYQKVNMPLEVFIRAHGDVMTCTH